MKAGLTERLVSLYFTLMSAAVSLIASIASSSVTLYTFWLAIDSCAAVTALTAGEMRGSDEPFDGAELRLRSYRLDYSVPKGHRLASSQSQLRYSLTMQGTWTRPSIGSQVRPRLCSAAVRSAIKLTHGEIRDSPIPISAALTGRGGFQSSTSSLTSVTYLQYSFWVGWSSEP